MLIFQCTNNKWKSHGLGYVHSQLSPLARNSVCVCVWVRACVRAYLPACLPFGQPKHERVAKHVTYMTSEADPLDHVIVTARWPYDLKMDHGPNWHCVAAGGTSSRPNQPGQQTTPGQGVTARSTGNNDSKSSSASEISCCLNPKHWFTTSFLGERCRKAMLARSVPPTVFRKTGWHGCLANSPHSGFRHAKIGSV